MTNHSVTQGLSEALANTYVLFIDTPAHKGNAKGPPFDGLHSLFVVEGITTRCKELKQRKCFEHPFHPCEVNE